MPRLSKIGAAALAAFGWTGLSSVTASYLQVAGGGGAGSGDFGSVGGAGGGAGGYLTGTTSLNPTQSYTVVVGAGGAGGVYTGGAGVSGVQGSNSQFGVLTASVGGGFGAYGTSGVTGGNGGSGGGGSFGNAGGTATSGQGSNGGTGSTSLDCRGSGGGGGASAVGSNGSSAGGGNGGNGTASSITGTSVTYAGGGGGGALYRGGGFTVPTVATGGTGGGGSSGTGTGGNGNPGTANLGGGGGGPVSVNAGTFLNGGNGGSGVVIISYPSPQKFGGGIVTTSGGNVIHTFTTSGTLSPLSSLTASALVVAGGGGGGANGGGGGAGGYRTGSGITLDTNSTYLVAVGAGGGGGSYPSPLSTNGSNSVFNAITSAGGGSGATAADSGGGPSTGGSGGGGFFGTPGAAGNTPPTSPSQGNNGGNGFNGLNYGFGGGGGSGSVGANGTSSNGGNGGAGTANSISGASVTYAGGGGGGIYYGSTPGTGSAGGGNGGNNGSAGGSATANTGSGGGGGGSNGSNLPPGGNGGSGIVIISYPGTTQLMAGGTVTISGGNVIHTFTSSGYLTPLTLVGNSLRFRSSASAYLNRTPASAGNQKTWTWSGWVKRGTLGSTYYPALFMGGTTLSDAGLTGISFIGDTITLGGYNTYWRISSAVYRDPAAWYHVVVALDTTQAVAANRALIYVNGVQVTAFSTNNTITQNTDFGINQAALHTIGYQSAAFGSSYYDGYMTEINFIDGQALTPNSFGTFNQFGVWQPIRYGGSYGTNGFYLKFNNAASTTTLGLDSSPQGNNWTTNNISVTAGSTYDSMTDVPTLTSTTAANYAVLNPLAMYGSNMLISNANLTSSATSTSNNRGWSSTIAAPSSGKWYAEFTFTSTLGDNNGGCGIMLENGTGVPGESATTVSWRDAGTLRQNATGTSYGSALVTNDVVIVAYDAALGRVWFGKNGAWFASGDPATNANPSSTGITSSGRFATYHFNDQAVIQANFGQRPFAYTPPTGFLPLNTFNL